MPISRVVDGRRLLTLLLGWALLYDRGGRGWRAVGELSDQSTCERVRTARIHAEVLDEIGGALANQPEDNPLRQEAYRRAEGRVRPRYECERRDR
ncbi:MAG: hypothetical protein ACREQL_00040 [Candidatus Binatia bacterium]